MKALIATLKAFGSAEQFEFVEKDVGPLKPDEILIGGICSTVSSADLRIRSKNTPRGFGFFMNLIFGFKRPRFESLGTDYLGVVLDVGRDVDRAMVGERLAIDLGMKVNGYRTLLKVKVTDQIARVPLNVSSPHAAAAIFGGSTALVFLRDKLKLGAGERVLILGAGGAVGSSAVQLAKHFGAEVSAVCSQNKATIIHSIGADNVHCYDKPGFKIKEGDYDVVLDCSGVYGTRTVQKWARPSGRVGFLVADLSLNLRCLYFAIFGKKKLVAGVVNISKADLDFLMTLIAQTVFIPVIGKTYAFKDVVAAHREIERGNKLGSTLLEY